MVNFADYELTKRNRGELTTGLVLYGENEPPDMQIENLWKIVHRRTGEELAEPKPNFDEFSSSDRMYPSMMKPEVKRRWDLKNYEWKEAKALHAKLKRMLHAQFMQENPNLPVVQSLKETTYGSEIQTEFKKILSDKQSIINSRMPQNGTGRTIRDEMKRDNVDLNEIANGVVQFQTPKSRDTFAVMGVDRDENMRIAGKILASAHSSHDLEYQYDEEGRLQVVHYEGQPVEVYRYNSMGQRVFSQVTGGQPIKYRYNEHGQLVQAGDIAYSYDDDGYLAAQKDSHGLTRYCYLETGQLCEALLPDGRKIEYRFDENGFRAEKLINGKLVQRYHWDDLITLSAVEDNSGVTIFHYDEDGDTIGMTRNGQNMLLATDQLGSIFTVADLSGNSVHEILYDSFGRRIQDSNPELELPLGFAGGLYDPDTGLIHFGYREYDPVIGRFISPDPLGYDGGDIDVYGYCLDDPVNMVDPLGLYSVNDANGGLSNSKSSNSDKSKSKRSSNSHGYAGNDFGPGYNGTSGSAYGPTRDGWGYNTDPGGSHYGGPNNSQGDGGTTPNRASNALTSTSSVQHAREMEDKVKAERQRQADREQQFAKEKAIREKKASADEVHRDTMRRAALKNKNKFSLSDLGKGAATGALGGAASFAPLGSLLGPSGTLAGLITGAFYGASVGALKSVGIEALANQSGINKKDLEDTFGILDTAKPLTNKRDFRK